MIGKLHLFNLSLRTRVIIAFVYVLVAIAYIVLILR